MCVFDESLEVCCGWTVDWSGPESRTGEDLDRNLILVTCFESSHLARYKKV